MNIARQELASFRMFYKYLRKYVHSYPEWNFEPLQIQVCTSQLLGTDGGRPDHGYMNEILLCHHRCLMRTGEDMELECMGVLLEQGGYQSARKNCTFQNAWKQ